ncbi:carbohydrate ABC transporter substrate-binding protein [Paenibacillus sp. HN-1]|uniref:ABC transporter substrate-binding protein n=1 Tax=Paenibacillus TaxID=44249 RepID=UPI001CA8443F|nr:MULTISPECIES: ABC transporter substrate-binding protein [Paenibacillus]MBY9080564.1 carbohydrate ABC transporter substrate-binding protein [Paenibacillus sp. CGMCC 1.18879]MBY9085491.1 carbohydrate ABC transporter substrate-binding protein [Paenibacillus sinensis]
MHFKRRTLIIPLLLVLALSGCRGQVNEPVPSAAGEGKVQPELSGTIVMLTNRVDLIENGTMDGYVKQFKQLYPEADVQIEGLSDYATDILVRLSTRDAGDVLLLPVNLPYYELEDFFEPLPSSLTAGESFQSFVSYGGHKYGMVTGNITEGIIYNKKAFKEAGVDKVPQTLDEFYEACAKLKNAGIIPLYMNYGAVWPLREWGNNLINYMTGDPDYLNNMVNQDEPWQMNNAWGKAVSIPRTLVSKGYVEQKLFSNNWEISKAMLAKGEAAMALLGNWAIRQIIDAGASSEDIGFFPFPYDNETTHYAPLNPDWFVGVSKYSKNKELAMAWIDFFVNKTSYKKEWGFYDENNPDEPGMPQYAEFFSYKPKMLEATVQNDRFIELANRAKLSFWSGEYLQELIAAPDLQKAFDELNAKWSEARAGDTASATP